MYNYYDNYTDIFLLTVLKAVLVGMTLPLTFELPELMPHLPSAQ